MTGTALAIRGRDQDGSRRSRSKRAIWMSGIALGTVSLVGLPSTSARAVDFEIQEATVEKGEVEVEYRGSKFDGQPKEGIVEEEEEEDEEESPLDNGHDVELQLGITERIMISFTGVLDKPVDEDFRLSVAEVEFQYELFEKAHSAMSLQFEYEFATIGNTPDEFSFGPLIEYWSGRFRTTANLFLTGQAGDNVETDGPGFEYALQFKGALTQRLGLGVEAFGEIEDLSNAGSFNDQEHYAGPMLYLGKGQNEVGESDDEKNGDGEREASLSFSTGVLFGLTDVTSDVVYRLNAYLEF